MRKFIIVSLLAGIFLAGCNQKTEMKNPFLADYNTPFNVPPFHLIQEDHYLPSFKEAMIQEKADIDAILNIQSHLILIIPCSDKFRVDA